MILEISLILFILLKKHIYVMNVKIPYKLTKVENLKNFIHYLRN